MYNFIFYSANINKMNFRTVIQSTPHKDSVNYNDNLFFIGSCFAKNIGERLSTLNFSCNINPFGAIYNPLSLCSILDIILGKKSIDEKLLVQNNELWYSLMHSTKEFNSSKTEFIESLDKITEKSYNFLTQSNRVFITLGTAWAYRYISTGKIANNCLKLPAKKFIREKLTVDEIVNEFDMLFANYPEMLEKSIYITVSPIRHLKDGFQENSLSKSTLIVATHVLIEKYRNISYFPSYEIMNDDLRDYRFYEKDMVHPNSVAVDYIFDKFTHWVLDTKSQQFCKDNFAIYSAMNHKPTNSTSEQYLNFCKKTLDKIGHLEKIYGSNAYLYSRNYFSNLILNS